MLLLEVGLGGRFDATNVIDQPGRRGRHARSATTTRNISAPRSRRSPREKAGIFKRGCPAVIAPQDYLEADQTLRARGRAHRRRADPRRRAGFLRARGGRPPRLPGRERSARPAAPAPRRPPSIRQCRHRDRGPARGRLRAIRDLGLRGRAVTRAEWPGRLQRLDRRAACRGSRRRAARLWLDGGHNPDGGRVLAAAMADQSERSDAPLVLIVGMLGTKDCRGLLPQFRRPRARGDRRADHRPDRGASGRGGRGHRGQRRAHHLGRSRASNRRSPSLHDYVWDRPPRVLICGSLYLAGEVLAANGTLPE